MSSLVLWAQKILHKAPIASALPASYEFSPPKPILTGKSREMDVWRESVKEPDLLSVLTAEKGCKIMSHSFKNKE